MGYIKLQMKPIVSTGKRISSLCSEVNTFTFTNNVMTLITLVGNSTTFRYERDERPRVRVKRVVIEESFLYDTREQQMWMPFKAFKWIYGMANCKRLPGKDLHIKDAGVNNLGYQGTFQIPMQMFGRKVIHDMVVLENAHDTILVIDFIRQYALSYNAFQI